ncbi:MAG: alpha/beta hydrolase, partial [Proteobacteria bacterium]|nr:alpha/beta hydrolase [Pseudomonadota bacterium]
LLRDEQGRWQARAGWSNTADPTPIDAGRCAHPVLIFDGHASQRLSFATTDTRFRGDGEELAGRLVLPAGDGPAPIAVLVHGSEANSAVIYNYFQRLLPAHGIGVFVYDKRGTGNSSGRYSQDFSLLANDAVAALKEARRLIELAYTKRPDDGYIIDSLGWMLFTLGEYDKAVVHLEKAVEAAPADATINEHFGDALWKVGRRVEARYQWQRALILDVEDAQRAAITKKLEQGLASK